MRETFDFATDEEARQAHKDDHLLIHRRFNSVVFANEYASVQAALDAASAGGLHTVLLDAAETYDITAPLSVPTGVTLDGDGALIRAATAMDTMIVMASYATITRCRIGGGNGLATNGVYLSHISERLVDNRFVNFANADGAVIKAGGALYSWLERNYVLGAAGYALDALNIYSPTPGATYYGMNVFTAMGNAWGGRKGVRIEGFGQSRGDTWELALDGGCALQVGANIQSHLSIDGAYFELTRGLATELIAVRIMGSARVSLNACQIYGALGETGMALHCNTAYGIGMTNCVVNRWQTGIGGIIANNGQVMVGGNQFLNTDTPEALSNLANAKVAMWTI